MRYEFFLWPLLVSFALCSFLLVALIAASKKEYFSDKRSSTRHLHSRGISRFGGVALVLAFAFALILDKRLVLTTPLIGVLAASGAILIFGVIDDIKQLSWKLQLFFQFSLVTLVYVAGVRLEYVTNPLGGIFLLGSGLPWVLGVIISIGWVVFLMNVMNFVDGVDGVSGGITMIASATIFILSQRPEVNQPPLGIITAALVGALAAFLLFNFYPAKIIAGTSGSMFMGFILAVLAIFAGAKIATTLMVLAVPILDALWVVGERFRQRQSVFLADRRHLHFKLIQLGWSARKICSLYYLATIAIAFLALSVHWVGKTVSFFIISVILFLLLGAASSTINKIKK